jgi:hypothetical protein
MKDSSVWKGQAMGMSLTLCTEEGMPKISDLNFTSAYLGSTF